MYYTCARTFSSSARGLSPKQLFELSPGPHVGGGLPTSCSRSSPASSGHECFRFSPLLWFSNDVCSDAAGQTLGASRTRVRSWSSRSLALCRLPKARIHGCVILVLICLYCLGCLCMKFDQLILRKIIEIVATRCQILRIKCTKFDFGWGSTPDPATEVYSPPQIT